MALKFVVIAGGIFLSFWVLNVLQEKLYGTYGPRKEKFSFAITLMFFTTGINCLSSFVVFKTQNSSSGNVPVLYQYSIGLAYLLSMFTSLTALKWVSYPARILAKSAKPVPVLIMGTLIGRKTYHFARYVVVLLVVAGLVLFTYRDDKAAQSKIGFGFGELLLVVSLVFDGIVTSLEERAMSNSPSPINPVRFMFDVNVAAVFFLGFALVLSGEIFEFACFARRFPFVLFQMIIIGLCGSCGQFFIFQCITGFGTLTCSILTTTRKFFTVLSSIVVFGHVLLWRQWAGIIFVFGGVMLDIYFGKFKRRHESQC